MVVAVLFGLGPALLAARTDAHDITRTSGGRSTSSRPSAASATDSSSSKSRLRSFWRSESPACARVESARANRHRHGDRQSDDGAHDAAHSRRRLLRHRRPRGAAAGRERRGLHSNGAAAELGLVWRLSHHRPAARGSSEDRAAQRDARVFHGARYTAARGRNLSTGDGLRDPGVLLVNETLARLHFPGEDPVGRATDRGTIVGVVGDVPQAGLNRPVEPEIYKVINRDAGVASDLGMTLVVRTDGPPEDIVPAVRAAVRDVNPVVALFNIKTMAQVVADSLWELNLYRWLIGLFAALALVLAAIGLYGVISYGVASRTREFAVRLALGSEPAGVAQLVLQSGLRLATAGLVLGIAAGLGFLPVLRRVSNLFVPDAVTFTAIVALLLTIALAACLVPALRVARVNPAAALRHDLDGSRPSAPSGSQRRTPRRAVSRGSFKVFLTSPSSAPPRRRALDSEVRARSQARATSRIHFLSTTPRSARSSFRPDACWSRAGRSRGRRCCRCAARRRRRRA